MKFGLEQHIIDNLIAVFEQNSKVDKAILFGSRAKGNYRPDSDIDIAIKGQDLHTDDIIAMSIAFEEKGITYKIDLLNYDSIKEPDLKDHIDRAGIEFYSRWKECKLGDYIETINGFAFKSADFLDSEKPNSLPIIKIKNVANGDVNIDGVHYHLYSDNLKKYVVEKGDILISLTGNHPELETQVVGLVSSYKLETKALLNQRVGKLFSKKPKEFNDDYLYYFLKNKDTHQYLASQSSGSANQANISKTDIEKISFSKPPLHEQIAIATTLSSLDDKIDLLHRQNKTLEQLAETLFRQWFVEEAEESWEVGTVLDLFKLQRGFDLPTQNRVTGVHPIVASSGISETHNEFKVKAPGVTTGRSGSLGDVFYIEENFWPLNTSLFVSEFKMATPLFTYFYLKTLDLKSLNGGSAVPTLNRNNVHELETELPPKALIEKFEEITKTYFRKIKSNQTQIRTLTQTRDTLLPKLMSGEIRLNYDSYDSGDYYDSVNKKSEKSNQSKKS